MQEEHHPDDRIVAALWVASPQTVQEHGRMYHWLLGQLRTDPTSPGPVVVFDETIMPVEELIEALSDESAFVESAVFQARRKGITEASMAVLFFSASGRSLWPQHPPEGELAYLGLFAYPADDAYKE
jgi:hypothetical protein